MTRLAAGRARWLAMRESTPVAARCGQTRSSWDRVSPIEFEAMRGQKGAIGAAHCGPKARKMAGAPQRDSQASIRHVGKHPPPKKTRRPKRGPRSDSGRRFTQGGQFRTGGCWGSFTRSAFFSGARSSGLPQRCVVGSGGAGKKITGPDWSRTSCISTSNAPWGMY